MFRICSVHVQSMLRMFSNVQTLFRVSSTKTGLFRISWLCSVLKKLISGITPKHYPMQLLVIVSILHRYTSTILYVCFNLIVVTRIIFCRFIVFHNPWACRTVSLLQSKLCHCVLIQQSFTKHHLKFQYLSQQ